MICEFYRIDDKNITKLKNLSEDKLSEFLVENYSSVYGQYHKQNDTVFSLDKAWDVARFLLKTNDSTADKILDNIFGEPFDENSYEIYNYLLSDKVKNINQILLKIQIDDLYKEYDEEKMISQNVYKASGFHWTFIKQHIETISAAFKKAAEQNDGLIINIG
ncbi:DUF1877 family protein [Flavobacterium sp. GCM10027622]|uniref:DUF1877 family protein n=1 Tax=unclassified Flavobacterium TaxID=196869 RepID=UPI00360D6A3E